MSSMRKRRRAQHSTTTHVEEGVLKLMKQPHVLDAVLKVLSASADKQLRSEKAASPPLQSQADKTSSGDEKESSAELPRPDVRAPRGRVVLPSLEDMQAAGYQGSGAVMRSTWAWAKEGAGPSLNGLVWPTPTAGESEPLSFDACGWPDANTTCEEWINMLTYWQALREQLVSGASRSQRNAVDRAFAGHRASRRGS